MPKQKVYIDMTQTCREKITGWERFAITLEDMLLSNPSANFDLSFLRFEKNSSGRIDYLTNQLAWYFRDAKNGVIENDIFHSGALPPPKGDFKKTWTIHDDIILGGHKEYARSGAVIWNTLGKKALKDTNIFITPTKYVASELMNLGIPSSKIEIISPAITEFKASPTKPTKFNGVKGEESPIDGKFAIIVGSIEKRKNPVFAANLALKCGVTPVLVGGFANLEAEDFPLGTLFTGRCSDSELLWLYENAEVLITASFYEGVNLPIFEALNLGTKVVASDIGVHKELTKGMVQLFPFDLEEASKVLRAVINSEFTGRVELPTPEQITKCYYDVWDSLK
jgi:glycosyltransferase involved in cell wall biosynthesis